MAPSGRATVLLALAFAALTACRCKASAPAPASAPSASGARSELVPGFLKGQLHAHTSRSGDSSTSPSEAAAWFAQHGFDFVVFTDHNYVTNEDSLPGMLVFRRVELPQNSRTCDPPPRLGDACLLHVNALFVAESSPKWIRLGSPPSNARIDIYGRGVDRAIELGGLAQLNHPDFQGGADLDILMAMVKRGVTLVEIANQAVDSTNEGGPGRLSTEDLWDAALVRGAHVFGTATDDAHHYNDAASVRASGGIAYTGDRGFVMVRAARSEEAIRRALVAGDFYASSGLLLERAEVGKTAIALDVRQDSLGPYVFEVIANGARVDRVEGASLRIDPRKYAPGYVRVRVTDGKRHAWTQPVWL